MELTRGAPTNLIKAFFERLGGELFISSKEVVETFEASIFHDTRIMLQQRLFGELFIQQKSPDDGLIRVPFLLDSAPK